MCARFSLTAQPQKIEDVFEVEGVPPTPRHFNIAPTDQIVGVVHDGDARQAWSFRWGLVPFWAKSLRAGVRMINARSETVLSKQPFKNAMLKARRCLVPTDGFYEWLARDGAKLPFRFVVDDGDVFAMAGLWAPWGDGDGNRYLTATVLTTTPNALLSRVHDRMPVILPRSAWQSWLDPASDPQALAALLTPFDASRMQARAVTTRVNNVRNEDPDCLEPGDHYLP